MTGRSVYVVCAPDEEDYAERLAAPLRAAGYQVEHSGTAFVGDAINAPVQAALASNAPIVVCATLRAAGGVWAQNIVNAARTRVPHRVFLVQMEEGVGLSHLSMGQVVADYHKNRLDAEKKLLEALDHTFPRKRKPAPERSAARRRRPAHYLDVASETYEVDIGALERFRKQLRPEPAGLYPDDLTPEKFLDALGLMSGDSLTRAGVLVFGSDPAKLFPESVVQCVHYRGTNQSAERDIRKLRAGLPDQIVAARHFVAERIESSERPTASSARSERRYSYPMVAVREIIANALVHRDYSRTEENVHVRLFDDRLEVSSPGSWTGGGDLPPGEPTPVTRRRGQSRKRNQRLARVLSLVNLVEGEGSGLPTAVKDCENAHAPALTLVEEDGFVTFTVRPSAALPRMVEPRTRSASAATRPVRRPASRLLARRLRELRESGWPERPVTQRQLAHAFDLRESSISGYENPQASFPLPDRRLVQYATFFATRRSLDDAGSRILPDDQLSEEESTARDELLRELRTLAAIQDVSEDAPSLLTFPPGDPILIVTGKVSTASSRDSDPNRTKLHSVPDADSLLELFAHLRMVNPDSEVRFAHEFSRPDDLTAHLIFLGRTWMDVGELVGIPITQVYETGAEDGAVFLDGDGERHRPERTHRPEPAFRGTVVRDVGLLARAPNPYNTRRSLTIFSGSFPTGVYGAVRTLTGADVRDINSAYLSARMTASPAIAVLMEVPVLFGDALAPDLSESRSRLYEWTGQT